MGRAAEACRNGNEPGGTTASRYGQTQPGGHELLLSGGRRPTTAFGKNLSIIRKQRQLTQLELASLLEVQPRMVGRWEQGQAKPQFAYVIKLAQVLEVSIDRLIFGEQGQEQPAFDIKNKRLKELCKQADSLKQEDQEVICRLMDMAIKQDRLKQIIN